MRVLAISNLYPPYFIGGYELGCRDVMQVLARREHQVAVLTSTYGVAAPCDDAPCDDIHGSVAVRRALRHFIGEAQMPSAVRQWRMNLANHAALLRSVREFKPEVIYLWNLSGVSLTLAFSAQNTGLPVCYYVSDLWLRNWENEAERAPMGEGPARLRSRLRAGLRPLLHLSGLRPHPRGLDLRHAQCTSRFVKEATARSGKNVQDAPVIHWGIEVERFTNLSHNLSHTDAPCRLIYAGQLAPHKGVATAIEAVALLRQAGREVSLTLAGPTTFADYENQLRQLARDLKVDVDFRGLVARDELPAMLAAHDVFVFPSVWDEPFSIGLLEGMAAGLAVVSTTTGGSREIVWHEENALAFEAGDARDCASQITRLIADPALCQRLRTNARRIVEERFTLDGMTDQIEDDLRRAIAEKVAEKANDERKS